MTSINKYILPALIIISSASCKKFLDVKPTGQISEDVALTTKDRIQRALTGAYSRLQVQEYYGAEWPNAVWLSDDNVTAYSAGTTDLQFDGHAILSSSNTIEITWKAMYQAINAANNVIDAAATVDDPAMTDDDRNNITGQALFIRALVYFDLARTFGGVPLVLTPTRGLTDKSYPAKNTVDEVYTQVIKDLTDAEAKLPDEVNRNIAHKKAVQALRARVALYRNDWATAEAYATTVINSPDFALVQPFEKIITEKNNTESIFELAYSVTDQNVLSGYYYPVEKGGFYRVGPTAELIGILNDPAKGGNRSVMVSEFEGAPYGNRYRAAQGSSNDDNYAVLRLAEMYLIRAEARANQDNIEDGADDLDQIRNRAGLGNTTANTKETLLQAIEDERRVEFAFEPFRWFDLIRTGRAGAVLGVDDATKYVFPLPASEVLTNKNLKQNTNY
ncbi:MAG: RagB/SusD family nutrient uptake outer membrane protein [Chitinophagaceae bacterium]|nr:RagB/SusD family nutrient uptake outer membrane protein [Chitinophagaceae bacterium]